MSRSNEVELLELITMRIDQWGVVATGQDSVKKERVDGELNGEAITDD